MIGEELFNPKGHSNVSTDGNFVENCAELRAGTLSIHPGIATIQNAANSPCLACEKLSTAGRSGCDHCRPTAALEARIQATERGPITWLRFLLGGYLCLVYLLLVGEAFFSNELHSNTNEGVALSPLVAAAVCGTALWLYARKAPFVVSVIVLGAFCIYWGDRTVAELGYASVYGFDVIGLVFQNGIALGVVIALSIPVYATAQARQLRRADRSRSPKAKLIES